MQIKLRHNTRLILILLIFLSLFLVVIPIFNLKLDKYAGPGKSSPQSGLVMVSANIGWCSGSCDYYFRKLSENGIGTARVILAPWNLENGYDFDYTDKLEKIVGSAERYNISLIVCLNIYGELRSESSDERERLWSIHPYNRLNGGFLNTPEEFFTNEEAKRLYRNNLKQIVEQFGDSENIAMWELWNEVDLTDNYSESAVCEWHREMAGYLRRIDPVKRPVTTSFADAEKGNCVWNLSGIDVITIHYYSRNITELIPGLIQSFNHYNKPVILEEFAWANNSSVDNADKEGRHLHDALWISIMAGYDSTAMAWWWDEYIDRNNLWWVYKPLSAYVRNETKSSTLASRQIKSGSTAAHILQNTTHVFAWILNERFDEINLTFTGLREGNYSVELWDTYNGGVMSRLNAWSSGDFPLSFRTSHRDTAVKIKYHS